MKITEIYAVYFSAVENTRIVVTEIAEQLASALDLRVHAADFTLPPAREQNYEFGSSDLVVFGTPTYAGKVPNKVLPFVQSLFRGNHTPVIPVVTFGNRSYDNALAELKYELEQEGFCPFAAAAFSCHHVFSDSIAVGRPDAADMEILHRFTAAAAEKICHLPEEELREIHVEVKGQHDAPYYIPKGVDGRPAKFLKAKPKTDMEKCDLCGLCAKVCPMGSINPENIREVPGICIKCQACIRKCPKHAKYIDDPAFLSHKQMLEQNFTERVEPEVFL